MIEKDIIDEVIFRTENFRNRLMLELMARGGLKIGEVLNVRPKNCQGCKLILMVTDTIEKIFQGHGQCLKFPDAIS